MESISLIKDLAGIELDRITNAKESAKTIKHLMCSICLNLLLNPVSCSKCQTNFCESCIDAWIKAKRSATENCVNRCDFSKATTPPIIKGLLSDLQVSCVLKGKGCQEVLNYDELIKHEEECLYQNRACSGCGEVSIVKEIVEHERGCDRVLVMCNGCKSLLTRQELVVHGKDKAVCIKSEMENMRSMYEKMVFTVKSENQTLKIALEEEKAKFARFKTQFGNNSKEMIKKAGIEVPKPSKPVCDKNHELKYYPPQNRNYPNSSFVCNKCRVGSVKSSFHCPECKYDVCSNCYSFPYSKDKCMYNHDLVKTSNRDYGCDRCFMHKVGVSYYCNVCAFDLCEGCHKFAK